MVISSNESCDGYWDQYDSLCLHCDTICVNPKYITECTNNCKEYIQITMMTQESVKADIHKLTIMVAATAAMTSLVLLILFFLLVVKLNKKKKKVKGILPYKVYSVSSDQVDINSKPDKTNKTIQKSGTSNEVSGTSNDVSGTSKELPGISNEMSVLSAGKLAPSQSMMSGLVSVASVGTVTTELSEETLQRGCNRFSTNENSDTFNRQGSYRATGRGKINMTPTSNKSSRFSPNNQSISRSNHNNHNNNPSRLPSEDCVMDSEGGCHNLAMDSSSTSLNTPVTHSQVV